MVEALEVRRMLVAMRQMLGEPGVSQRSIAERIGVSQGAVRQWLTGYPVPKHDKVERFGAAFNIAQEYFENPRFGEAPDYREHVGRRVDRDDAKGAPTVESYIAMEASRGQGLEAELVEHLRSFHFRTGDIELEDVLALARAWRARQAERRVIERPPAAVKIDEARGQRKLEPAKKRRAR